MTDQELNILVERVAVRVVRMLRESPLDPAEWVPVEDVAADHGVSVRTVKRRIESGKVQGEKRFGKWMVRKSSLKLAGLRGEL